MVVAAVVVAGLVAWFSLSGSSSNPENGSPGNPRSGGGELSGGMNERTPTARPGEPIPSAAGEPGAPRAPEGLKNAASPVRQEAPATGALEAPNSPQAAAPPAAVSPALDATKEDIRAAIHELTPEIRECFNQGLKTNPNLDGKVRVDFVLARAPDGGAYAREGEVGESTLNAPLVEACILSKLQTARFENIHGDGEVRVRYPFKLSSGAGFGGAD
jgi:hypothetical protein